MTDFSQVFYCRSADFSLPIIGKDGKIDTVFTILKCILQCFSEAAEECYISQSAISQQIQALERELGVSLPERRNRKFTVTPAGEHFYKKSLILTADVDKLCRETAQIGCGKDARICVGYLKGYSGREFHQAVADFTEKYPDVSIQIINGCHEELEIVYQAVAYLGIGRVFPFLKITNEVLTERGSKLPLELGFFVLIYV